MTQVLDPCLRVGMTAYASSALCMLSDKGCVGMSENGQHRASTVWE